MLRTIVSTHLTFPTTAKTPLAKPGALPPPVSTGRASTAGQGTGALGAILPGQAPGPVHGLQWAQDGAGDGRDKGRGGAMSRFVRWLVFQDEPTGAAASSIVALWFWHNDGIKSPLSQRLRIWLTATRLVLADNADTARAVQAQVGETLNTTPAPVVTAPWWDDKEWQVADSATDWSGDLRYLWLVGDYAHLEHVSSPTLIARWTLQVAHGWWRCSERP